MPRAPPNFRRSDFQRAIRGAREEGLDIERIEVAKDGGFTLHPKPKLEITNEADAARQRWTRAPRGIEDEAPKEGKSRARPQMMMPEKLLAKQGGGHA
jgi:hypothetical protein